MKSYKNFYEEIESHNEAKEKKASFDLDDLDPVKYPSLDNRFSKHNAKKRKKADCEHESVVYNEAKSMDGDTIKVGDSVGWKDGFEQYGKVKSIRGSTVIVTVFDSNTGKRSDIPKDARRVWVESYEDISTEIDEALTVAQRRKRAIITKRNKAKLARGRKKADRRIADKDRISARARRRAKAAIVKKLTKGVSKADLSPQRKAEIERRLSKMNARVERSQKRILPKVRKDDRGL